VKETRKMAARRKRSPPTEGDFGGDICSASKKITIKEKKEKRRRRRRYRK